MSVYIADIYRRYAKIHRISSLCWRYISIVIDNSEQQQKVIVYDIRLFETTTCKYQVPCSFASLCRFIVSVVVFQMRQGVRICRS